MSFKMFIIVSNRETQTKTTVKVHHIPIRMPKISKTNDNKNWRDVGKHCHSQLVGLQLVQTLEVPVDNSRKAKNTSAT